MFKPIAESLPSPKNSPDERRPTLISSEAAEALAILVIGAYRASDVSDPAVYISTVSAVISGFTEEIATEALNPRTGLQTRSKWLPTVSEIREACEQVAQAKADRERRRMLNEHRVLLDTPYGLRPEREALVLLQSPDAQQRMTEDERAALAERVRREFRAIAEAQRKKDAPPREDVPLPELADPDAQRLWYEERLEVLRKRIATEGLPQMSDELRKSEGLAPRRPEANAA